MAMLPLARPKDQCSSHPFTYNKKFPWGPAGGPSLRVLSVLGLQASPAPWGGANSLFLIPTGAQIRERSFVQVF